MDFITDLIKTRGAQLISRYAAMGVIYVSAKIGVSTPDAQVAGVSEWVAGLVVAGVLIAIDHFSHAKQAEANK